MYNQKLKIPWPEFGDSVRYALMSFSDEVAESLEKEAKRAATQCKKDIQNTAPKRSGEYAKSWTVSRESVGYNFSNGRPKKRNHVAYVVHANKPGYQLAHLLERSHSIRNQYSLEGQKYGDTIGQPHIENAAIKASEQFTRNARRIITDLS